MDPIIVLGCSGRSTASTLKDSMWSDISKMLRGATEGTQEERLFSGCALCVRTLDEEIFVTAQGMAERAPAPRMATVNTVWDLASLTKVLCTAPLILKWYAQGKISPDLEIASVLPHAPRGITVAHCLSHSSGYPAWRPFYAAHIEDLLEWDTGICRKDILHRAVSSKAESQPMVQHKYSDIGFLALCAVIEEMSGLPLDEVWRNTLPTAATRGLTWGHPTAAATEQCPVRQHMVTGEVHDLNAAAMGNVSSHAGLFGDVRSVAEAACWPLAGWHGRHPDLPAAAVHHFWTTRGAGTHCLGWDTPSPLGSSASDLWPRDGVGHLGFTGCSIWIAPSQKLVAVFLSNRIHPIVEGGSIPNAPIHPRYRAFKAFRPMLHRKIFQAIQSLPASRA
jgi:serine-type D-Ala-D-Ala carboxypeptidase